jgi:membrane protein DedA with SNARE-associated domain
MVDWLLGSSSYFGIVLFLVLTGCGLPIPEEVAIIAAGVASAAGSLNPWWAFVACLVGALLGDCVMYAIGYHFGHNLARMHPRFAHLLHAEREAKIEEMMRRHGLKVFFVSRFVVGLRSPIYLTAGILRISFQRFLLIDSLCATAVVGTFFYLSYRYGEHILKWVQRVEGGITLVVIATMIAALVYFWRRHRMKSIANQVVEEALALPATSEPQINGKPRSETETKATHLV